MMTKRDALELADSLPGVAPAISKADALAALEQPHDPAAVAGTDSLLDPVGFAATMDGHAASGYLADAGGMMAPREWASLCDALAALRLHLERAGDAAGLDLLGKIEDGGMDFAVVAHMNGLRAGAAYEHLRLAIVLPERTCPACDASYHHGRATCAECGGTGVVATPGVVRR